MGGRNTDKSLKKTSRNGRYWDRSFLKKIVLTLTIFTDMTGPVTAIL